MKNDILPWIDEDQIAEKHPSIFHYTRYNILEEILKSGGLHATHYSKTNDRKELRAANDILIPKIADRTELYVRENIPNLLKHVEAAGEDVRQWIHDDSGKFCDAAITTETFQPHIACFSYHAKAHHIQNGLLTMWRSYCSQNDGIAIAFDANALIKKINELKKSENFTLIFLQSAMYGSESEKLNRLLKDCDDVFAIYAHYLESKRLGRDHDFDPNTLGKLFFLMTGAKHPDFSDERELRLVVSKAISAEDEKSSADRPPLIVRVADCITHVLIGPSNKPKKVEETVEQVLKKYRREDIRLQRSSTPFKAM